MFSIVTRVAFREYGSPIDAASPQPGARARARSSLSKSTNSRTGFTSRGILRAERTKEAALITGDYGKSSRCFSPFPPSPLPLLPRPLLLVPFFFLLLSGGKKTEERSVGSPRRGPRGATSRAARLKKQRRGKKKNVPRRFRILAISYVRRKDRPV